MLLSKFMTSQPRKQTLQYTNFSTSQEAKTMKFGQLIEYDMRNIFLEKLYTKCCGGTISRPFSKKSKLSISLNKWSKFLFRLLSLYAKLRAIDKYWNEAVDHLLLPHVNIFWKKKKRPGTSLSVSFSVWFLKRYVHCNCNCTICAFVF